jgi:hypothetical protein
MATQRPIFELARFAWGAPDRLEVSGKFVGLPDLPADAPTLVISGADGVHRLPVVPDGPSGPLEDGRRWDAVFAWQEPPVAFEGAKLEFADIVVELPEPATRRTRARRQTLEVTQERAQESGTGREPERADGPAQEGVAPGDGVERLRITAELLATQEALRESQSTLQRTQEELTRVRDDLASERDLRSADTERFHQGLAAMSDAAAEALTAEQLALQQRGVDLREALEMIEAKDAALLELRGQLEAAAATQTKAEAESHAEIGALRERLAKLKGAGKEADRLRAKLGVTQRQVDEARAELDQTRSAMDEARSDVERLLGRLSTLRDTIGDGG